MRRLLTGLMVCSMVYLLVSLLPMARANGVGRSYSHLLVSPSVTTDRLQDREWAIATTWSDRDSLFRTHAGEVRWKFGPEKWQWGNMYRQLGWIRTGSSGSFLRQDGDSEISKYRFSRFYQFQGAVRLPG